MARSETLDKLQVFRFSLQDAGDRITGGDVFDFGDGVPGGVGFHAIGGGTMRAETTEIKEGTWPFSQYVVNRASMEAMTIRRAVMPKDSDFYNWFIACLFGDRFTRRNLILNLHRRGGNPGRSWLLHHCLPIRCSPWPELDSTSSEVAIAEIEIQPEYIEELV